MKKRCYPKYGHIINGILSVIMLLLALGPLFFKTDDSIVIVVWICAMSLFSLFFAFISLQNIQYYYFENGYIIAKSFFGEITRLKLEDCEAYVERLSTYNSRGVISCKNWLCIYDKSIANSMNNHFKSGFANKKKLKKIQILYSDENLKTVEQHITFASKDIAKTIIG